jgi:hypothetical protein
MKNFSGYIEGYYGRMFSWEERAEILTALQRLSLNTYVYGPKEDPFHRRQWKLPYPEEWIAQFKLFVKDGKKKNVRVIPSLSPGLSYDYRSTRDYRILLQKFEAFVACGAETVALFMDDIPEKLPRECAKSFSSLGQAHAALLSRLVKDLRHKQNPRISLWFCPTVYCDRFAKGGVRNNRYLLDCAAGMPRDISLLWTGPSVVSEKIDGKELKPVSDLFHGNLVIWDNLYANDYCPNRLFIGPYRGRSPAVLDVTKGICLNPTGLLKTDILLLGRLSALVNKKLPSKKPFVSWMEPAASQKFKTVAKFFDSPFVKVAPSVFSSRALRHYHKALRYLLWDWKSPLQREWYPFLLMLDTDLNLIERVSKKTVTPEWLFKKYPLVLSSVLSGSLTANKKGKA